MDIERIESAMKKFLSENCADTNATVLQIIRTFLDHVSNVFNDQFVLYETRDDMERIAPDAADTNVFFNMVTRLQKEYNERNPGWQAGGGDIRMGRFGHLPEPIVPCGLTARRHHGTKTGPDNDGHGPPGTDRQVTRSLAAACTIPWPSLHSGRYTSSFHNFHDLKISTNLRSWECRNSS